MKFKTTKKAVKANYPHIISVGHQKLYYLLSDLNEVAYTVRREGWASDIYELTPNVVISTGYHPFGTVKVSDSLCHKYEMQAQALIFETYLSIKGRTTLKQKIAALRSQFIQEVLRGEGK